MGDDLGKEGYDLSGVKHVFITLLIKSVKVHQPLY